MDGRRDSMLHLDWPPVWTAGTVALVWLAGLVLPWRILGPVGPGLGALLALAGFALMGLAAAQMMLARTTLLPHETPSALVSRGLFAVSRNPIYLGDLLILVGAMLFFHVPWALPLVVIFVRVIERRFILPEEARLRASFGAEFDAWTARTARWLNGVPFGNGLLR